MESSHGVLARSLRVEVEFASIFFCKKLYVFLNQDFVTIVLRVLHLIGPLSFSGSVQAGKRSYPQQKVVCFCCESKLGFEILVFSLGYGCNQCYC